MQKRDYLSLLLRVGVAFALIYPAVSAYIAPLSWIGFFPPFVRDVVGSNEVLTLVLHLFGITEIVLALWILAGRHIFIPSALAAVMLFLIVALNISQLDILFRDIPIMLMAMALTIMYWPNQIQE